MRPCWTAPLLVFGSLQSLPAGAFDINGYAVVNHQNCSASNLPGTLAELNKFFGSDYFPDDYRKNFLWVDGRVRASEWNAARDAFASNETASGSDGADSSLVSYIASHGTTSAGVYTALSGGLSDACHIRTPEMSIGDHNARYLVLSTCQGLKIGTGDDPLRPGENPQVTWATANQGLNCIFGYSNNMVDADEYGNYLLEGLATTDDTLVEAFFKAARRVNFANIPAALCFGPDDNTARHNMETARRFTNDRYGKVGSAWAYDSGQRLGEAFRLPKGAAAALTAREIKTMTRQINADDLAKGLIGKGVRRISLANGLAFYRKKLLSMTYNPRTGLVSWRKGEIRMDRETRVTDVAAIRVAAAFLAAKGVVKDPGSELLPTYIINRGALIEGRVATVAKTIVFHQKIRGLTPLAAAGSVEVTIDAYGKVVTLAASLIDTALPEVSDWVDTSAVNLTDQMSEATRRLARSLPAANITFLEARIGYDVGDYTTLKARSRLVVEVLFEATEGGFARRYVEKVPL